MIDTHVYPEHWGIQPVLFRIGNIGVPAYGFFIFLGLSIGLLVYIREAKRLGRLNEKGFFVALGALIGGIIGAKLLIWIIHYQYILSHLSDFRIILSGRSIIGGLIGGAIGALLTKKALGIKEKQGNLLAPAVAIGVAIGRIGCFFRGCCFGKQTVLPWGIDFGDGVLRHPTQLYESAFMLAMFFLLERMKCQKNVQPGQLFKTLMISYFIFRFFLEFIRTETVTPLGLTVFQIISFGAILYLVRKNILYAITRFKSYGSKSEQ